jgi:hypothetical protein
MIKRINRWNNFDEISPLPGSPILNNSNNKKRRSKRGENNNNNISVGFYLSIEIDSIPT